MIGQAVLIRHAHHLTLAAIARDHEDGSADLKEFAADASGRLAVRESFRVHQGPNVGQWILAPWQDREQPDAFEVDHVTLDFDEAMLELEPDPAPAPEPVRMPAPVPIAVDTPRQPRPHAPDPEPTCAPWVVISW